MPRCPLCGSMHIVVTIRPARRAYCVGCDSQWGLDGPGSRPTVTTRTAPPSTALSGSSL